MNKTKEQRWQVGARALSLTHTDSQQPLNTSSSFAFVSFFPSSLFIYLLIFFPTISLQGDGCQRRVAAVVALQGLPWRCVHYASAARVPRMHGRGRGRAVVLAPGVRGMPGQMLRDGGAARLLLVQRARARLRVHVLLQVAPALTHTAVPSWLTPFFFLPNRVCPACDGGGLVARPQIACRRCNTTGA
jgi:hypothetical protein